MREYMHTLLIDASRMLVDEWQTDVLFPQDMCVAMALVRYQTPFFAFIFTPWS